MFLAPKSTFICQETPFHELAPIRLPWSVCDLVKRERDEKYLEKADRQPASERTQKHNSGALK
jgi:hypothetical protein